MVSNRFEMEWPPRSGQIQDFPEVDRAEWMTLPQASVRLVTGQVEFLVRLRSEATPPPDGAQGAQLWAGDGEAVLAHDVWLRTWQRPPSASPRPQSRSGAVAIG